MATTTTNLGLTKPTVGADADQWGTQLNASLDVLDRAVQYDAVTKTLAATDVTLSADEASKAVINLTGTLTANVNVIVPATPVRVYLVNNGTTGAFSVTVKTAAGTGTVVTQGANTLLYSNGTNIVQGATSVNGSFSAGALTLPTGTTNGVAYLNGSKVLTTGAGLTFDGTNFATTGTTSAAKFIPTGGTATGNGMYLPAANTLAFSNNGTETLRLDSAGNLGLGVTPSAWGSNSALQMVGGQAYSRLGVTNNAYFDGTNYRYIATSAATLFGNNAGSHLWFTAPSGTAGQPISFTQAMTLTQGGNLLVGATVDSTGSRIAVKTDNPPNGYVAEFSNSRAVAGRTGTFLLFDANNVGNWKIGMPPDTNAFSVFDVTNNTERARITSGGNFRPGADNAYSLGEPTFRWSVVYAATGTINTSDERAKLDFAPTLGLDFIAALEPVSYRYRNGKTVIDQVEDGIEEVPAVLDEEGNEVTPATTKPKYKSVERVVEGTRRHHGLKAQQVKLTLDKFGVDFAGWVLENPDDPNSGQGLRYDQFIAPLIKAVQELQQRVIELEAKNAN